jgi:hypothetical protein
MWVIFVLPLTMTTSSPKLKQSQKTKKASEQRRKRRQALQQYAERFEKASRFERIALIHIFPQKCRDSARKGQGTNEEVSHTYPTTSIVINAALQAPRCSRCSKQIF